MLKEWQARLKLRSLPMLDCLDRPEIPLPNAAVAGEEGGHLPRARMPWADGQPR